MVIFLQVDQNLITFSHYHGFEGGIICYSGSGTQNHKQNRFHLILMHRGILGITNYIGGTFHLYIETLLAETFTLFPCLQRWTGYVVSCKRQLYMSTCRSVGWSVQPEF